MPVKLDFNQKNVFLGKSKHVLMAKVIDNALANSEEFIPSYVILGVNIEQETIANNPNAITFRKVINAMRTYFQDHGLDFEFKENKSPRYLSYRYPKAYYGTDTINRNPFAEHRKVLRNIEYEESILRLREAIAFLPESWRDDFFGGTKILIDNEYAKMEGLECIAPENSLLLTGINYLPEIYKAIVNKTKLLIQYSSGYSHEDNIEFHPQFLKQYNGRWYACGRALKLNDNSVRDDALIALDRIIGEIDEAADSSDYVSALPHHYNTLFDDVVGVTHDSRWKKETIVLQIHSKYVFNLLKTKKLHKSQKEEIKGDILTITLDVQPNKELTAKILSFGSSIEVKDPPKYREHIAEEVYKMNSNYK